MARRNGTASVKAAKKSSQLHFSSVQQSDVPHSRKGKHNHIVADILGDVGNVSGTDAVKIPRDELGSSVQKVRSALSRASKKGNVEVATAADDSYLYVWRKGAPET